MKRIYILVLVLLSTTVSANKVYLINNSETYNITNNDRYNYEDYIISSNMELNVSASDGILSNDIIKDKNRMDKEIYSKALKEYARNKNKFSWTLIKNVLLYNYKFKLQIVLWHFGLTKKIAP